MVPASRPARAPSRERRRSPRLLPLSALLLVAVACQGATGGAQPQSGSAPQTAPGGATAAPPAQPIKIGALFSTTGLLAPFGTDGLPGAQIYVDEIRRRFSGYPLAWVPQLATDVYGLDNLERVSSLLVRESESPK